MRLRPLRVATLYGVPVYLQPLLVGLFPLAGLALAHEPGVLLVLVGVLVSVLLHELAHAWTARSLGVQVRDVRLGLFGGMARLRALPRNPLVELVVAAAGPAVNLVAAFGLAAGAQLGVAGRTPPCEDPAPFWELLGLLAMANAVIGLFNLLPAHPLDGGRILWSLCALAGGPRAATRCTVAVTAGVGLAFLGAAAATGGLMLGLIGAALLLVGPVSCLAERCETESSAPAFQPAPSGAAATSCSTPPSRDAG